MAKNQNLLNAKNAKNDEFYTQYNDIEKELINYKNHLENKIIYCNCDDPEWSNFWKYFHLNFNNLKLKKLIATFYNENNTSYKMEYIGGNDEDITIGTKSNLKGNGDFRNEECIEILKESDIVITNPPFSLAREYFIPLLYEYNKLFLIVGDLNWVVYKNIFLLLKNNVLWTGYNHIKGFIKPDGNMKKFGNILWFTNINIDKCHNKLLLTKSYNSIDYPKYDNYDAINIDKITNIPCDYYDYMGVPITLIDKYNPNQFKIVDAINRYSLFDLCNTNDYLRKHKLEATAVNKQNKCFRIIIQRI